MRYLSLAQGDPIGKDLLSKLVNTRYGTSPPAIDVLRITYAGRSRSALGPFTLWAKVEATATYRFPSQFKWAFKIRLLRIMRTSFATSFDGEKVYEEEGRKIKVVTEPDLVESARRRAWAETVFFVSPLIADHRVQVEGVDARTFRASMPGVADHPATVRLNEDNTLQEIAIERADPASGAEKTQFIRPIGPLESVDGLSLPGTIQRYWGDELLMELSPVKVEMNPELAPDEFVLKDLLAVLHEDENAPESSAADEAED